MMVTSDSTAELETRTLGDIASNDELLAVEVDQVESVADGVRRLTLRRRDGQPFPTWDPGSHIDVHTPEHVRQYSLCSSPSDTDTIQVSVLHTFPSRGGSQWVHQGLREGQELTVSPPRNNFPFIDSRKYLFVAGGIGITPILPMIESAEAAGREWRLVYGGRSRSTMAFLDELEERWGDRVLAFPSAESGRIDLESIMSMPRAKMLIYACGPDSLLTALEDWARGWPPGVLHTERFVAAGLDSGASSEPFDVELARTGTSVTVDRETTVLEAIEQAGVRVLSSCRVGVCGTCETDVITGEVDHRDAILSPEAQAENQSMMVCVSRAAAGCPRLVLDL